MKKFAEKSLVTLCAMAALLCLASAAHAHRMHIYAWLEGGQVIVDCAFSRSQPVIDGQVTVYDNVTNRELLQGRTNRAGSFSFAVPDVVRQGHGLRIEVNAGQGHVSDWVMEANQLYEAAAVEAGLDRAQIAAGASPGGASAARGAAARRAPRAGVDDPTAPATREHVHAIVNDALDAKLAPLHKRLAAMEDRGIGITEVFGGIGWLIGLFGIWFYYRGKKR